MAIPYEKIADWFLPDAECVTASPSLIRKRAFVLANVLMIFLQGLDVVAFLLANEFSNHHSYTYSRIMLLTANTVLCGSLLALLRTPGRYETAALVWVLAMVVNITAAVATSGGGLSPTLSWYVVIAVAAAFFLTGWRRNLGMAAIASAIAAIYLAAELGYQYPDHNYGNARPAVGLLSVFLGGLFAALLASLNGELYIRHELKLAAQASRDPLTKLLNRRGFDATMNGKFNGCLVLLDIDHFKKFNDSHGHAAGDQVLVTLAERIKAQIRPSDSATRLGGEEFAIWLNAVDVDAANLICARLKAAIAVPMALSRGKDNQTVSVAVSGGLVSLRHNETLEQAMARADNLLYDAKLAGRNQIFAARE